MNCRACRRRFVTDGSPLAVMGYCMTCRPGVTGDCTGCGEPCQGKPDGELRCWKCRDSEYNKRYLYADTTGGRLWRLVTAGMKPGF